MGQRGSDRLRGSRCEFIDWESPAIFVDPSGTIIDLSGNSPEVQEKFAELLMRLEQTPRGKELVDRLRSSSTVVKIDVHMWKKLNWPRGVNPRDMAKHAWTVSSTARNKDGLPATICVYTWPDTTDDPLALLAHELAHAEDMILGTFNNDMDYPSGIRFSEIHACQVENEIRIQLGLSVRKIYVIISFQWALHLVLR